VDALNSSTAIQIWNYSTIYPIYSNPALANGVVYVRNTYVDGKVFALNAATGELIW
jgi:outer membrane protein assembly factor BamB